MKHTSEDGIVALVVVVVFLRTCVWIWMGCVKGGGYSPSSASYPFDGIPSICRWETLLLNGK